MFETEYAANNPKDGITNGSVVQVGDQIVFEHSLHGVCDVFFVHKIISKWNINKSEIELHTTLLHSNGTQYIFNAYELKFHKVVRNTLSGRRIFWVCHNE